MAINVSSWSIRNPTPAILLFVMLTLAGLLGFRAMKIQNFPDIDLPMVTVTASPMLFASPNVPSRLKMAAARIGSSRIVRPSTEPSMPGIILSIMAIA